MLPFLLAVVMFMVAVYPGRNRLRQRRCLCFPRSVDASILGGEPAVCGVAAATHGRRAPIYGSNAPIYGSNTLIYGSNALIYGGDADIFGGTGGARGCRCDVQPRSVLRRGSRAPT